MDDKVNNVIYKYFKERKRKRAKKEININMIKLTEGLDKINIEFVFKK